MLCRSAAAQNGEAKLCLRSLLPEGLCGKVMCGIAVDILHFLRNGNSFELQCLFCMLSVQGDATDISVVIACMLSHGRLLVGHKKKKNKQTKGEREREKKMRREKEEEEED